MKREAFLNLLNDYKNAGLFHAIDLQFTRFLYRSNAAITNNTLLAACLTSYLYRQGNVCLTLEDYDKRILFPEREGSLQPLKTPDFNQWKKALTESPEVGSPGEFKPLILDNAGRLYLHKLWMQEQSLTESLLQKAALPLRQVDYKKLSGGLNRLFHSDHPADVDWQKVATAAAILQPLVMVSGGPGTGKTTTVIRILALLLEQLQDSDQSIEIALAAPTGKAASRLNRAIIEQKERLNSKPHIIDQIPENAATVHRLLGARLESDTFKFTEDNKLPHDLIIVDEVSMVDQRLMNSLLLAVKPTARLILLGDKDQLASVEAGSVLGDICRKADNIFSSSFSKILKKLGITLPESSVSNQSSSLTDNIVLLEHNYRFGEDSGIAQLVVNVKRGEAVEATSLLKNDRYEDIQLVNYEDFGALWENIKPAIVHYYQTMQNTHSASGLLDNLQRYKILCAHRRGPFGVENLNRQIERMLRAESMIKSQDIWYEGRPVIIRRNDYQLQLRNGDVGVCQRDENGDWIICFRRSGQLKQDEIMKIHPDRLSAYEIAYAMTVHQSQGSEFDEVLIVLPNHSSKILTRELLYTAISRARSKVTIIAQNKILKNAIANRLSRNSGLTDHLW